MKKPNRPDVQAIERERCYAFLRAIVADRAAAGRMLHEDRRLLEARINAGSESALHYLAIENQVEGVCWLLDRGADVNQPDDRGTTALHYAAWLGYEELCRLLLKRGADIHVVERMQNRTPLSAAATNNSRRHIARTTAIVQILLDAIPVGEDVNLFFDPLDAQDILDRADAISDLLSARGLRPPEWN